MKADVSNLGELEMAVLAYVWERGEVDVKRAHREIGRARGIMHNTVQSTFKRLWKKRLLSRRKEGHAYLYAARVDRRELTELLVGNLVGQVAGDEVGVALEAFVNLADRAGSDTLDALEKLIAARRRRQGERSR